MKLTKKFADGAEYEGEKLASGWSRCVYWDDEVSGFGLRVFPSGKKSFVLLYRARGRKRQVTLGVYGVLTVQKARKRARRMLVEVVDGGDPLEVRRKRRSAPTVAKLAERYMEEHARPKKRPLSVESDERLLRIHILPRLGRHRVADVDRAAVSELHHAMRETPTQANRALALLSKMFNLAEQWGYRPDHSNPTRHMAGGERRSRRCGPLGPRWRSGNAAKREVEHLVVPLAGEAAVGEERRSSMATARGTWRFTSMSPGIGWPALTRS